MRSLFGFIKFTSAGVACTGLLMCSVTAANYDPQEGPDAFDTLAWAQAGGKISAKDSVILRAKLLFAPEIKLTGKELSVLPISRSVIREQCLTGFYKDVHKSFRDFSADERNFLCSLNEDIDVIIKQRESEESGTKSTRSALPNFPQLDKQTEGNSCIVHYSLDDATDKVPDDKYADIVKTYVDMAIKNEPKKKFRAALPEGGDKLHVYIMDLDGANGVWIDVSATTGKAKSGYIKIDSHLKTTYPAEVWELGTKGTCFHEYFHGVQSAYNWDSSLWFMEGTCRWTEMYFVKCWFKLKDTFDSASSIFKAPSLPIYDGSFHKYSTVTLAYYFYDNFGGVKFILKYFENTEKKDDAIEIFKDMMAEKGKTFSDEFKKFLAAMYLKKISSLKKYMIDVEKTEFSSYGAKGSEATLSQLGAVYYKLLPQTGIPQAPLIYGFVPGSTGKPEAFILNKSKVIPVVGGADNYEFLAGFGKSVKEAAMIVTDTEYSGAEEAAKRSFDYEFLTPYINITDTQVNPTEMEAGSSSQIDITYDLLGTHAGEQFPMQLKVVEKGPGVNDGVSGEYYIDAGYGANFMPLYFNTSAGIDPGTYRFTVQFSVPSDSWVTDWGIPQSQSKSKFAVKVTAPPENAGAKAVDNSTEVQGATIGTTKP